MQFSPPLIILGDILYNTELCSIHLVNLRYATSYYTTDYAFILSGSRLPSVTDIRNVKKDLYFLDSLTGSH